MRASSRATISGLRLDGERFLEFDLGHTAAAFLATVSPGVIDEDLAHELRGHAEEMRAALPVGQILRDEPQIGFVYERGGLQGGGRVLVAQVVRGQAPKLVVDDGNQAINRRRIAVLEIEQQPCDLSGRVHLSLLVKSSGSEV